MDGWFFLSQNFVLLFIKKQIMKISSEHITSNINFLYYSVMHQPGTFLPTQNKIHFKKVNLKQIKFLLQSLVWRIFIACTYSNNEYRIQLYGINLYLNPYLRTSILANTVVQNSGKVHMINSMQLNLNTIKQVIF